MSVAGSVSFRAGSSRATVPALPQEVALAHIPAKRSALDRMPAWLIVLAVYLGTRVLTTTIMLVFAHAQPETWQTPAQPDYFTFANIWDASWYRWIATSGYPAELPVGDDGAITENAWAFMPVYPMLCRALMVVMPFDVASVVISLVGGWVTLRIAFALLRRVLDVGQASFGITLFALGPASVLFQVGYAESLQLAMLMGMLWLVIERQWLTLMPLVFLASLTRPTGLAWAFTLVLIIAGRYWRKARREQAFDRGEQVRAWISAVWSGLCGIAWLLIAAAATGNITAYLDTEMAWRNHYTGGVHTLPFTPWFWAGDFWFKQPFGTILVLILIAVAVVWLTGPWLRPFGLEVRMWGIAYASYLFAVFYPQSSVFRLLVPLAPAAAPLAVPRSGSYRFLMAGAAVLAQITWLTWMWFVIGHDWTPP